jgi:hypothetical protein
MKFGAKRDPPASTVGVFFAPNFIQNLYTVLKKRLWESRSTPTLEGSRIYADVLCKRLFSLPKTLKNKGFIFLNAGAAVISLQCIFWPNFVSSFIIGLNSTKFGMQSADST